ncbi:nicotinate-nucleotide adenylyltransferase [Shewanella sp. D64]|uniref:nicotinate-nucleotide adenylyltransferase n=1 Tax=unclassified Shewanella TaxID=196818 RepID=UPI0022BA5166|nr:MULTISPECIES: nicotinate-nucleotide adenylyltransferase [unclassified Shewanella]MEC4728721.1 nicotinate-nucleotide adenylyltransferase [Shewanella sp. D64]MEC4740337.1 nicotinate-nucleotide adenylyltransferase [Shewanella sp. E94]WBJ94314.1 nicotinate-nucleotide adenylyltransferase [Shewanella sp. MTB7]
MRIGILGGTFDPIHFGHIRPAIEVKQLLNLDKIWLMPNHIPPHKTTPSVNTQHRVEMAQLVCDQYAEFELCDIEVNRQTPSYLVTTLEQITLNNPDDEFYFIMGMDSLITLTNWYKWQSLFTLCHLVVCQRQGWNLAPDNAIFNEYQTRLASPQAITAQKSGLIIPIKVTPQAYSSTEIRQQLSQGSTPTDALPNIISEYIKDKNLYQTSA